MNAPTLSIVIPTAQGPRANIARLLDSIAPQLLPDDQVLVIGDTRERELVETEAIVATHPAGATYVPYTDGAMTYGHSQINHGLTLATGDYVLANDDDDLYTPTAFACIRAKAVAYPDRVLLCQFLSHWGQVFWHTPGLIAQGHIGGHCLVTPNRPGKVGQMGPHYEGDYTWIVDTLSRWETPPVWVQHVIAVARPEGE